MELLSRIGDLAIEYHLPLLIFLAALNLVAFLLYGIDKAKAKRKAWRIPERRLIAVAFIGGSLGAMLGMLIFKHKTKHTKFLISLPLALTLHTLIAAVLLIAARLG